MSACQSSEPLTVKPTLQPLDSALSKPCDTLTPPQDNSVDTLIESHLDLIKSYNDCATRHNAVIELWKSYSEQSKVTD